MLPNSQLLLLQRCSFGNSYNVDLHTCQADNRTTFPQNQWITSALSVFMSPKGTSTPFTETVKLSKWSVTSVPTAATCNRRGARAQPRTTQGRCLPTDSLLKRERPRGTRVSSHGVSRSRAFVLHCSCSSLELTGTSFGYPGRIDFLDIGGA